MNPADFTIEFYRKCLSQCKYEDTEQNRKDYEFMKRVADERGGPFMLSFCCTYPHDKYVPKPFPVASQEATETQNTKPNTNTTMNTLLKDIYETLIKPLVDAIDRNTAAKGITPSTCSNNLDGTPPPSVKEDEDKPAEPKKRGPKAKAAEPAPEPTPVVEKEVVQEEEPYLTGPELVELMKPLKDTPYTKKLVEFRDGTLGFPKMTREMSDPAMLRQMEAKIREFLAANEEDQKDAA